MKNNYKEICDILRADSRFVSSEGSLLKNKIVECANKMDTALISLLYKNDFTKSMFFVDADGIAVFDKVKFGWVIESEDFLPDSYTRFKNNILLTDGSGNSIKKCNDVVLEFPHKDCILEMDSTSEDEERKEVFLNETIMKNEVDCLLSPKCLVNAVKHSQEGSKTITEINEKDNLVIKGNNLLVLHSLLPRYTGQIKLMYWDILYNTQNDKVPYNDSFKHSSWLVMMKNRLEVAKKLLREDGSIWLHCDDNEQAYLKVLCDEVFGRDNFINCVCVKMYTMSGPKVTHAKNGLKFPKLKEYILIYTADKTKYKFNIPKLTKQQLTSDYNLIIPEWKEEYNSYLSGEGNLEEINNLLKDMTLVNINKYCEDNKIKINNQWIQSNLYRIFASNHNRSLHKALKDSTFTQKLLMIETAKGARHLINTDFNRESDGTHFDFMSAVVGMSYYVGDCWYDNDCIITSSSEGGVILPLGQKPEKIIKRVIESASNKNDIVLDAYLGSGTTAAVAHKMGRKYIGIEQLDSHFNMSIERLNNVINGDQTGISKIVNWNGGDSFISCRLADNSQNVIDKIMKSNSEEELKEIYKELKLSDFVLYRVDINKMSENENSFNELSMDDKKKFLVGIIDKNTLYVNYSDIDDFHYDILEEDKKFTKSFYEGGE